MSMASLQQREIDALRSMLKSESGLALAPTKTYLLESRLSPLLETYGLNGWGELIRMLEIPSREGKVLKQAVVEAMTTNETYFLRDRKPFEFLKQLLPTLLKQPDRKTLRIWSAACSTGQEPYSIMILLHEAGFKRTDIKLEFIATDLDTQALDKAKAGRYSQFEIQRGLAAPLLIKYFQQDGAEWVVKDELKAPIQYRQINLLSPIHFPGKFDIIMCRNVLIYMDQDDKQKVINDVARHILPDGYFFMGAAETLINQPAWKNSGDCPNVYQIKTP